MIIYYFDLEHIYKQNIYFLVEEVMIAKEKICGMIGLILSLPIAYVTYSYGALCCFYTTFWSVGTEIIFIVLPILTIFFSITGFLASILSNRYPFFGGIFMLIAFVGLIIISPFFYFIPSLFFLLGSFITFRKFVKKHGKIESGHALIIVGTFFIVILFIVGINYFLTSHPYEGKFLYTIEDWSGDIWGGHIDYYGNYVAWIEDEGGPGELSEFIYILDISDEDNPSLISKQKIEAYGPTGPFIINEKVLWSDNGSWYLYNISSNQKNIVDLDSGIGIHGKLLRPTNNVIYIYDLYNGTKQNFSASPLCVSIYKDYVIWAEKKKNCTSRQNIPYDIWIYNLSSSEKSKIIKNLNIAHELGASIDIHKSTIVFSNELSIYTYNIFTNETKKIADHSRINARHIVHQYFSNIRLYGENIIYVDISHEIVGMDDYDQFYSYWVVNISSGKKIELKTAYCIYKEKVVGITIPWESKGLYLVDLNDLF